MPINQGIIGYRALINGAAPLWVQHKWGRFQGSIFLSGFDSASARRQLTLVDWGTDAVSQEPGLESRLEALTTTLKRSYVFHNEVSERTCRQKYGQKRTTAIFTGVSVGLASYWWKARTLISKRDNFSIISGEMPLMIPCNMLVNNLRACCCCFSLRLLLRALDYH